tara:strand:+ start:315 stop:2306 length:1992 start_codon:yes stop_codon:yes gene_type:complete
MKLTYRPELDGLRAIAVGAVVLYHAQITIFGHQPFKGGFIGVDIFFVISGYLITSIILKELITTGSFSFKHFYERRIRRIIPVLLFVMLVSLPFAWMYLLPSNLIDFLKSILYSLGFSSNFYFWYSGQQYGAESGLLKPFLHIWSLSVEEQYYILFPIVLLISFKYLKKYLIYIFTLGFFVSLGLADWGSKNHPSFNFYILPTRGWELLAGSIIAYFEIIKGKRSENKILNLLLPSLGLLLIGHSILFFNDRIFHPSFYTLSPIIGVCLIIWFSNKDELITKILSTKIFVAIGLISYSLYLWHYPIFVFARITEIIQGSIFIKLLLIIITFILSTFSYYFIERTARDKKNKFKIVFLNIFLVYFFLVISSFIVLNKIPNYLEKNVITKFKSNLLKKDCIKINDSYLKCSTDFKKNKKKIYLVGDSHIGFLSLDLKNRIIKNDYEVNIITQDLCIFFRKFDMVSKKTQKNSCTKINYLNEFLKEENSIFVIGGRFPMHLNGTLFDNEEGGIEPGIFDNEYVNKGYYKSINESFYSEITKLSHKNRIIFVYPIPETGVNVYQKIFNQLPKKISLRKDLFVPKNPITTSYEVYKKRTKSSFQLFDSIDGENISRVYPHTLFCDKFIKDRCVTHNNKDIFYVDYHHPSTKGAEMINDLIIKEISSNK